MRPANIVTSVTDVLAGITISGFFISWPSENNPLWRVLLLCFSTAGLYGGGVVFNDIFDAELDRHERPERPIPSGIISIREALTLGVILFIAGIMAAGFTGYISGLIAFFITVSAIVYDKWGKHHSLAGPLNMGLCRGLNLLLGVSILPSELAHWWFLGLVPVIYIASITMISRGEVHGGTRMILYTAFILYSVVIGSIAYFSFLKERMLLTLIFLIPFAWLIFRSLINAIREPAGKNIGRAVKAGVLGLILMNAAWAAAFGALYVALVIALLLPLSFKLAKMFAVT